MTYGMGLVEDQYPSSRVYPHIEVAKIMAPHYIIGILVIAYRSSEILSCKLEL